MKRENERGKMKTERDLGRKRNNNTKELRVKREATDNQTRG